MDKCNDQIARNCNSLGKVKCLSNQRCNEVLSCFRGVLACISSSPDARRHVSLVRTPNKCQILMIIISVCAKIVNISQFTIIAISVKMIAIWFSLAFKSLLGGIVVAMATTAGDPNKICKKYIIYNVSSS